MAGNYIFIGKGTSFNGTLTARKVVVEGYVEGDVHAAQKVLIKSEGIVNGCIQTEKLLFEKGGQHSGLVHLGNEPMIQKRDSANSNSPQKEKQAEKKLKNEHETVLENTEEENNEKRLW